MTSGSNSARAADTMPYATLRATQTDAARARAEASPAGTTERDDFVREEDKLRKLREALWDAFEAGPAGGLPNSLIDLTLAYTGALRLQLSLRAVTARRTRVQANSAGPLPAHGGLKR